MLASLVRHSARNGFWSKSNGVHIRFSSTSLQEASATVQRLKEDPGNESKLKLYALYKQATVGPCNAPKPGALDFVGKFKWDAWNKLGPMSKEDAEKEYVLHVKKLVEEIGVTDDGASSSSPEKAQPSSTSGDDHIVFTRKDGVLTIRLNRPKQMNAVTPDMYNQLTQQLIDAGKDDSIKLVILTGTGDYYSSGNDLKTFAQIKPGTDVRKLAEDSKPTLLNFVGAFIDFPKPLVAAVNGHAFGIMVTTLALCDVVVCSDTATFITPFSATAQTPEGCSSVLFPRIFGYSKASEILMFNYKLSAAEALKYGFVSKVIPKANFEQELEEMIHGKGGILKTCVPSSYMATKQLVRNEEVRRQLHEVNKRECDELIERWLHPDFMKVIVSFMSRKK